jgi:hypothetical protein
MADFTAPTTNRATDAADSSHAPSMHGTPRKHSTTIGNTNLGPRSWTGHTATDLDESSPLLRSQTDDRLPPVPPQPALATRRSDRDSSISLPGRQSKSSWYMFLLTVSMLGLQIAW